MPSIAAITIPSPAPVKRSTWSNRRRDNPMSPVETESPLDDIAFLVQSLPDTPFRPSVQRSKKADGGRHGRLRHRSVHAFAPAVTERESSLYPHRLDYFYFENQSGGELGKSVLDFTTPGQINLKSPAIPLPHYNYSPTPPSASLLLYPCTPAISDSEESTGSGSTSGGGSSGSSAATRSRSASLTLGSLGGSAGITWASDEINSSRYDNTHIDETRRSKLTSPSVLSFFIPKDKTKKSKKAEEKVATGGLARLRKFGIKSEIWSQQYLSSASMSSIVQSPVPVPPPRSALRTRPTARPSVSERESSLYPPSPDAGVPALVSSSPPSEGRPQSVLVEKSSLITFGKKKSVVVDRDPMKIRDGRSPTPSSSGIYTPTSFPGATGHTPTSPTNVYTPPNYQNYPSAYVVGSRASTSSNESVDFPSTPTSSPFAKSLTTKTLAGWRRLSSQLPPVALDRKFSYSSTSSSSAQTYTQTQIQTPTSSIGPVTGLWQEKDYFSASPMSASSTQQQWSPFPTPTSVHAKGATSPRERDVSPSGMSEGKVDDLPSPRPASTVAGTPKGKRKPVPKVDAPLTAEATVSA